MNSPASRLTWLQYKQLVELYRTIGVWHATIAKRTNLNRMTVRRAYFVGYPDRGWPPIQETLESMEGASQMEVRAALGGHPDPTIPPAPPPASKLLDAIQEEIENVRVSAAAPAAAHPARVEEPQGLLGSTESPGTPDDEMARAQRAAAEMLAKAAEAAKERLRIAEQETLDKIRSLETAAKVDSIKTIVEEAQITRSARTTVLSLYHLASQIMYPALVEKIGQAVRAGLGDLTAREAVRLAHDLARIGSTINEAASKALTAERQRVGEPTEIVQVQAERLTFEEAEQTVAHAADMMKLARQLKEAEDATLKDPGISGPDGSIH